VQRRASPCSPLLSAAVGILGHWPASKISIHDDEVLPPNFEEQGYTAIFGKGTWTSSAVRRRGTVLTAILGFLLNDMWRSSNNKSFPRCR
jgi:hypothetical protein